MATRQDLGPLSPAWHCPPLPPGRVFCFLIAPHIWEMWVRERGVTGAEWLSGLRSPACGLRSADGEVRARTVFICSENRPRWWPWRRARCQLLPWGLSRSQRPSRSISPLSPHLCLRLSLSFLSPPLPPPAFLLFIFFSDMSKWTLMLRFLNRRRTLARQSRGFPAGCVGSPAAPPPPSPEAVTFQSQSPHLEMTYLCHHFTIVPF